MITYRTTKVPFSISTAIGSDRVRENYAKAFEYYLESLCGLLGNGQDITFNQLLAERSALTLLATLNNIHITELECRS